MAGGDSDMSGAIVRQALLVLFLIFLCAPAYGEDASPPDNAHAWSKEEAGVLRSLWIGTLPPPPLDPSNAFSDDPRAARLGESLFFDKRFSKNGKVSCGTCHERSYNFTEEMPRAHGIGSTVRRTQPLIGMAYIPWFFWDGRADSLWAQALGPPENPNEHGISRTFCALMIKEHYRKDYEEVFGPLPDLPRDECPPSARPDPEDKEAYSAWTSMPPAKRTEVSRVYANMGKAIAAYARLIIPGASRFDRYVEALLNDNNKKMAQSLDPGEVRGLRLFIGKAGCIKCHNGPLFTNGQFWNIGVYQPADLPPDNGRADGIRKVLASEFNCLGEFSDAAKDGCAGLKSLDTDTARYAGAFKVPTLRNVAERAPYMHAGQYWALWEVLRFKGRMKPFTPALSEDELAAIEAFLKTLSGPLIVPEFGSTKADGGHHH